MPVVIWKFTLEVEDEQYIDMPPDAIILSVQVLNDIPCIWAAVPYVMTRSNRLIYTYGTGVPIEKNPGNYIGTYQLRGGAVVYHVFDGGICHGNQDTDV